MPMSPTGMLETDVLGHHCPGDMTVCMRNVLAKSWVGFKCFLSQMSFGLLLPLPCGS